MRVFRAVRLAVLLVLLASQAFGQTNYYGTATVQIPASQAWTDTGVDLVVGERVIIGAWGAAAGSGIVAGVPQWHGPDGVGDNCQDPNKPHPSAFMNLLGRIGASGAPFAVGSFRGITADTAGRLFLGVNDGIPGDNSGGFSAVIYKLSVNAQGTAVPNGDGFGDAVLKSYPNPFNSGVSISLAMDRSEEYTLELFDVSGRRVHRLPSLIGPGMQVATWDGRNALGEAVASGVYFLRARSVSGDEHERRIVLSR